MDPGLSLRAQKALKGLLPVAGESAPPQHLDSDTTIDLSHPLNEVIHPELLEFLKSTVEDRVTSEAFDLPDASLHGGNLQLRNALAAFFNTYFNPIHAVKPEHIVLTAGATDAIENVIHAVCDDGDSVLVPGPHWLFFESALKRKANVNMVVAQPPTYAHWDNYLLPCLQAAYDFSDKKLRIKAVLMCNPAGPLARCYARNNILELMEFCQERGLHLIMDEVCALTLVKSGDEKAPNFVSALSLTEPLVPEGAVKVDPSRVHVIWSASKLFGMSGFRVSQLYYFYMNVDTIQGCVISQQNTTLLTALSHLSTHPTSLSTLYLTSLLTWPQLPTLLALNSERLTLSYQLLASCLHNLNVDFVQPTHGIFLLAKLAKGARTEAEEKGFYEELAKRGVRVAHGKFHRGVEKDFGWCRIRFSVRLEVMQEAVMRIERFMEKRG